MTKIRTDFNKNHASKYRYALDIFNNHVINREGPRTQKAVQIRHQQTYRTGQKSKASFLQGQPLEIQHLQSIQQ